MKYSLLLNLVNLVKLQHYLADSTMALFSHWKPNALYLEQQLTSHWFIEKNYEFWELETHLNNRLNEKTYSVSI